MAATTTIEVPHLGGIQAGYQLSGDAVDPSKPTVVLINSMCTTVALYKDQFESKTLTDVVNLLAIEPLGHGATSSPVDQFTYWDTAVMALQVMDQLGVKQAFALGTSQGGWIVVRMALLAPERVCPAFSSFHLSIFPSFYLAFLPPFRLSAFPPFRLSAFYPSALSHFVVCRSNKMEWAVLLAFMLTVPHRSSASLSSARPWTASRQTRAPRVPGTHKHS